MLNMIQEEAPQSEANKELLNAFKCTTLQFEETEKDLEAEAEGQSLYKMLDPYQVGSET